MHTTKRQRLRAGLNKSKAKATTVPIAARGLTGFSPRARTREIILNAALKLYGRDGYSAVTMRALLQEIGCSAASIYTYFLDKNEIFRPFTAMGCGCTPRPAPAWCRRIL